MAFDTLQHDAVLQDDHFTFDLPLPFTNLDPYDSAPGAPQGELTPGPQGNISTQLDQQGGGADRELAFELMVENHSFRSDAGTVEILSLSDSRSTQVHTITLNGETVPVEYASHQGFAFEGVAYDQQQRALHVEMEFETGTSYQAETFDAQGNPLLTSYGYEQMLGLTGQGVDFGIEDFTMEFEFTVEIELNEHGFYTMIVSYGFDGEITTLDGQTRTYEHFSEDVFMFTDLDALELPELPQHLLDELARFAAGMGDAWDALSSLDDQLQTVFDQLKQDGHYDAWDHAGGGLDNPFDQLL